MQTYANAIKDSRELTKGKGTPRIAQGMLKILLLTRYFFWKHIRYKYLLFACKLYFFGYSWKAEMPAI